MLIKCPECGKDISSHSPTCIHCGYPITTHEENAPSPVVESQETEEPHVDPPVEEVVEEAAEADGGKPVRWISCPHCKSGLYTVERPVCISCGETVDVKPFRYGGQVFDVSRAVFYLRCKNRDMAFVSIREQVDHDTLSSKEIVQFFIPKLREQYGMPKEKEKGLESFLNLTPPLVIIISFVMMVNHAATIPLWGWGLWFAFRTGFRHCWSILRRRVDAKYARRRVGKRRIKVLDSIIEVGLIASVYGFIIPLSIVLFTDALPEWLIPLLLVSFVILVIGLLCMMAGEYDRKHK